ncbi:hypothetical protein JHK82_013806 [Glycine max]|nr:hypothetical protein JHK82_013806 [Glycine max]
MMEFTSGFGRRVWQNVLLVVEMTCAMCRNRVSNHIFVGARCFENEQGISFDKEIIISERGTPEATGDNLHAFSEGDSDARRNFMELVQNLTGLYRAGHDPEDADEADLKPPTPPRKEEPKANEAASPEEVESSCCNCVAPLIPDYNNANNYAVFESDLNKPLLTFANPSFFSG